MKTIEINLYKFNELSEDAKEKAINELSDINVNYEWWQWTYEDAEEIGLEITGFDLDRRRHAEGKFILSANEVAQNILNNHGETCETYKTAEGFLNEWNPIFAEYMDETSEGYESHDLENDMMNLEDDFLKSLLEDYSIMLQNEYEYQTSREAIEEAIIANEYEFYVNGEKYY